MKTVKVYYNIGDFNVNHNETNGQNPTLLSLSESYYDNYRESVFHSHRYLEVFCFLSGEGVFSAGTESLTLHAGDVLAVDAETIHSISPTNNTTLTFYALFIDNINMQGLSANCLGGDGYLHVRNDAHLQDYIITAKNELTEKQEGFYLAIKGIVYQIFSRLVRYTEKSKLSNKKDKPTAHIIKNYIDENFMNDLTLDFLASIVFVNKYYLIHSFKKTYNLSPMQYLTVVRMNRAKTLLSSTNESISEIASIVGYDNPVYFAETFKKTIGTTPSLYRKITLANK